jgi:hypothetical protein
MTRTCSRCKEEKPLTEEFFYRHKYHSSGFNPMCKECRRVTENHNRKTRVARAFDNIDKVFATMGPDDVQKIPYPCRRCGKATREIWTAKKDYERMKNKFYCADCHSILDSDDELFTDAYNVTYTDDVKASELPYIETVGGK